MKIRTIEAARDFVNEVKICTIFPTEKVPYPSLWAQVDLPDKLPGESGWGERMGAVWTWKNQLPADYPTEIFYGKIKGGIAVLMDLDYLDETHFPACHRPVDALSPLAQRIFHAISVEPWTTTDLRREMVERHGCTKARFGTALKDLQVSLNIVRACEVEQDTWLPFQEVHADIWNRHAT